MSAARDFSMPARLELRWKGRTPPPTDISGSWDISGAWDISGSCCSQIAEIDGYVNRIVNILKQVNARGDIQTADQRFDLLTSTLNTRISQLP